MRARDRFLRRMLRPLWPLLVWAAHFFFCYIWTAAVCQRGGHPGTALAVASALALLESALLLAHALHRLHREQRRHGGGDGDTDGATAVGLSDWVAAASAALALAAILWSCLPVLMLPACG